VAALKDDASVTPSLRALAAELHRGLMQGLAFDISQLTKVFLSGAEQVIVQDNYLYHCSRPVCTAFQFCCPFTSYCLCKGTR